MKQFLFLIFISTFVLTACVSQPTDDNEDVEDVLNGKSYEFIVQGFGMSNMLAVVSFNGGEVTVEDEIEGTYTLEEEMIYIEMTHEAAKIILELSTDDYGDGTKIEGVIETYDVQGENIEEERIEEVEEFEGLDYVLEYAEDIEGEEVEDVGE